MLKNLKILFSVSLVFSLYACTENKLNLAPANTPSSMVNQNIPERNQAAFDRSGIIMDDNGSFSFIADCAGQTSFKVKGSIEGQPCESDSFTDMDKFYIAPEYNKTRAVMVSGHISEIPGGMNILNSILKAGSNIWYLNDNLQEFNRVKNSLDTKSENKILNIDVVADTVWARDWAPLMTIPSQSYHGEKVNLKMIDTNYYDTRPLDDSISRQIRNDILNNKDESLKFNLKRESLPVYMEGGNIMCNEKNCYLSRKLITDNSQILRENDLILDEEALKKEFKNQIEQEINFVPMMPYEPTKHIDMWAKFLNEDTLLIASLSDETLNSTYNQNNDKFREIQEFLEMQATGKDKYGKEVTDSLAYLVKLKNPSIKIIRIQMPVPVIYNSENETEKIETYRSYTNSLLVNGYAIVPQYITDIYTELPYEDDSLRKKYENEVQSIYQQAGYKVIWAPSDYFIGIGGAVHCVTMQVPL